MVIERDLNEEEERVWAVYEAFWNHLSCATCGDGTGCDHPDRLRVCYWPNQRHGQAGWFDAHDGSDGKERSLPEIAIVRNYTPTPDYVASKVRGPGSREWATLTGVPPKDWHPSDWAHPDLLSELITLAHEGGHRVSWQAGNHAPAYLEALRRLGILQTERDNRREQNPRTRPLPPMRPLTRRERRLILAEEQRAWTNGRALLRAHGFTWWETYATREREGMAEYRRRFADLRRPVR